MTNPTHRPRLHTHLHATLLAATVGVALFTGCVTEGKRPPPPPQPVPPQPRDLQPDRVVRAVGLPEDTDRSGHSDLIPITVYLFATNYDAPLSVPGRFVFALRTPDGAELARWEFDEARTQAASRMFLVGPGYTFRLNLLDVGSDQLPISEPLLFVSFYPRHGAPVEPRAGTTIFMGGVR
jgi:hypothetical protein